MKTCPFCSEEIQDSAKKCRFCGEWLSDKIISKNNNISLKKLSIGKRILGNFIDIVSMYIFGIGLIINIYLYYKNGSTLGLKVFNGNIRDIETKNKPFLKNLIIRFLVKYFGILLLCFLFSALGKLILFILYSLLPSTEGNSILIALIVFILPLLGFLFYMYRYFKKNNYFWREKQSKTEVVHG